MMVACSITSYDWRHRVRGSGGSGWVDRSNVTSLIQAFSGLDASTEYDFRFRATNVVGDGAYSFVIRATTDDPPPVTVDHQVDAGNVCLVIRHVPGTDCYPYLGSDPMTASQ